MNRSAGENRRNFGSKFNGRKNFNNGPRELHKAKCADCGVECEVPFKPTQGRDVFCRDCFSKHKPKRGDF